jgi:hypothetical protein
MSSRVNELTGMMTRYSQRIASLQNQMAFINDLRRRTESFAKENGIGGTDAKARIVASL